MAVVLPKGNAIFPEVTMSSRYSDDWIIERWRLEPRMSGLKFDEAASPDQAPPLWKDLTLASVLALLLWGAAAIVFA